MDLLEHIVGSIVSIFQNMGWTQNITDIGTGFRNMLYVAPVVIIISVIIGIRQEIIERRQRKTSNEGQEE